ncbi:MAG: T9SS type A sorting domain-containing protein, partial [Saprospiraceae bacterium]
DNNILKDVNYVYRLKQVDFNGNETYSRPASVIVSRSKDIKTGLFPNPTADVVTCYIEAHVGANICIEIYNSLGQKVNRNKITEKLINNVTTTQLDCRDFGKGIYTVVITIDSIRLNHKLIIMD